MNAPQRRTQRSGVTPSPASASPRAGTASTTTSSRPVSGFRLNATPALVVGTISWITTATRSGTGDAAAGGIGGDPLTVRRGDLANGGQDVRGRNIQAALELAGE